jgi:hypothetical protein
MKIKPFFVEALGIPVVEGKIWNKDNSDYY